MERLRQCLSKWPPLVFTVITLGAILWLTLIPDPLGDDMPPLFPGADKIVHAIMFGGLTVMMLFDFQRKSEWRPTSWHIALAAAFFSLLIGVGVEIAQLTMDLGRGFEYADMAADAAGAFLFAICWQLCQRFWLPEK